MSNTGKNQLRLARYETFGLSLWFVTFAFLVCVSLEAGTANRGYDLRDGAYFLVSMADPSRYQFEMSEFRHILHPLYVMCAGDIAFLRLVSLLLVCSCAALFGIATVRACPRRPDLPAATLMVITIILGVLWLYEGGSRMPDYNKLNVSGLMIIFAAIMTATAPRSPRSDGSGRLQAVLLGTGAGFALAVVVLAKPTSGILVSLLGLGGLVLLRPPRPWLTAAVTAVSAVIVLLVFIIAVDDSILGFVHRKATSLALLRSRGTDGDTHGVWRSIYGPLIASRRWKLLPIVALSALLLAIYAGSFAASRSRHRSARIAVPVLGCAATSLLVAWWRAEQGNYPNTSPAYLAFHFAIVLVVAAVTFNVGTKKLLAKESRRTVLMALLLCALPAAYSFGTDVTLLRHMSTAPVFWIAASFLLANLAHPDRSRAIVGVCSGLCSAATLGMMVGVMAAPLALARPMWEQTNLVVVGPNQERLLVDGPTANYIRSLQTVAITYNMKPNTPIIDLSGIGPGSVYAINGVAPGLPWLHIDGENPTKFAQSVLAKTSHSEIQCAWILTGNQLSLAQNQDILNSVGLRFPENFELTRSVRHQDPQYEHMFWRPTVSNLKC